MMRGAAVLALMLAAAPIHASPPPEPADFRGEPYDAPVPETLAGATVLGSETAAVWQADGATLIDVMPQIRRPEGLPAETLWRTPGHDTIPGAVWLPGAGYERLASQTESAFYTALDRLTGDDRAAPLVFFCKADCWMSWNAARRAILRGHSRVGWFPGGTDDWLAFHGTLEPVHPFAVISD